MHPDDWQQNAERFARLFAEGEAFRSDESPVVLRYRPWRARATASASIFISGSAQSP
jgi:hypothetical protein